MLLELRTQSQNTFYIFGLALMGGTLFFWFKQVVQEHLAGLDSTQLNQSFVYGMAWFIFSEVMFFAAFFGALFYVRTFSVPWLGGEGEGISKYALARLSPTWPLLTTPDQGSMYNIPNKSMSFPGWDKMLLWLPLWNTIVLLSSSVTVHMAHINLKANKKKKIQHLVGHNSCSGNIFRGSSSLRIL